MLHRTFRLALLLTLAPALRASAQVSQPNASVGQPAAWQAYAGLLGSRAFRTNENAPELLLGLQRSVLNPVTGLLAGAAEAYGRLDDRPTGDLRLLARSPALAIGTGLDWQVGRALRPRVDWMFTWQSAIRRGGLLGGGTMLRVDWIPARGQTVALGVHVPLGSALAGRTRPRHTDADLSHAGAAWRVAEAPPPSASRALDDVKANAELLRDYANAYTPDAARALAAAPTFGDASARYARALADAFGAASGGRASGDSIAAHARAGLLDAVLLPYDTLFGQVKEPSHDITPLLAVAQDRFAQWLRNGSGVSSDAQPAVLATHAAWLTIVGNVHREMLRDARDSRFVWLPFTLALTPDQYDEQAEVDSLVARAVGRPFTDGNALTYLKSVDLPLEIARSIYAARKYHVLWTHDVTAVRPLDGKTDEIGYEMVADAYLPALTAAVQRYDSTGTMPLYLIAVDEYYYEARGGRIWMSILENPLAAPIRLRGATAEQVAHLRARQAELRDAVAHSARLQRDAAAHGGDAWIRRLVRVNVNVTQRSDLSFRSSHIVPPVPFTPDNIMRDHRKIVLYDLDEANPYAGAVFLMGIGIGEHYASATWEDRGYRLRGPAALEARAALRRLLVQNGIAASEIPAPLQEVVSQKIREAAANQGNYAGRALQVHNEVGFGVKRSSVVRAMMYDLIQPGSVVIVPDPLWLDPQWAGMLAGAAARGAQVQVVAPSKANAPSPEAPVLALMHDVMARLVDLRAELAPALARNGGALRVGIFTGEAPSSDPAGRRREVNAGLARAPWIRALFPFDSSTMAVLAQAEAKTAGGDATQIASDVKPRAVQLHQKTQLIARPGAIAALLRQPGWDRELARAMEVQSVQTAKFAAQLGYTEPALDTSAVRSTDALLLGYQRAMPDAERRRLSFYFIVGTQNMDSRGLALDGEASLVTSGFNGASGVVDLYYLMARSRWVTSRGELDALLPPAGRLMEWVAKRGWAAF